MFERYPCTLGLSVLQTLLLLHKIINSLFLYFQIRMSDLIAARILRYSDFDTLLYTCAPEFDFMEKAVNMQFT